MQINGLATPDKLFNVFIHVKILYVEDLFIVYCFIVIFKIIQKKCLSFAGFGVSQ